MDAARHYFPSGSAIDDYPVERFIVSGVVVAVLGLTDDQPIAWETLPSPGCRREEPRCSTRVGTVTFAMSTVCATPI
jgi:kynurenine formamidase